jgi:hypothetical protein
VRAFRPSASSSFASLPSAPCFASWVHGSNLPLSICQIYWDERRQSDTDAIIRKIPMGYGVRS